MSEKITWTHVDRHVRQALERSGTIQFGETDAEVAMGYIAFLERSYTTLQHNHLTLAEKLDRAEEKVRFAHEGPLKKTKQRLADIEENLDFIRRHLGLGL